MKKVAFIILALFAMSCKRDYTYTVKMDTIFAKKITAQNDKEAYLQGLEYYCKFADLFKKERRFFIVMDDLGRSVKYKLVPSELDSLHARFLKTAPNMTKYVKELKYYNLDEYRYYRENQDVFY